MSSPTPVVSSAFTAAGRASIEAWLAAFDFGREYNRAATAELLAALDFETGSGEPPHVLTDAIAEAAQTADSMARAQQILLYLTGASLFGMQPRKSSGEPIRLDLTES